jgi:hypothetical protein
MHGCRTWVPVVVLAVGWFYVVQDQFGRGPDPSALYPTRAQCQQALKRTEVQYAEVGIAKIVPLPRCVSTVVPDTFPKGIATPIWALPPRSGAKNKEPGMANTLSAPHGRLAPGFAGWAFCTPPVTRSGPGSCSPLYHSEAQCRAALNDVQKSELRWNGHRITPEPKCASVNVLDAVSNGQFPPRWEGSSKP